MRPYAPYAPFDPRAVRGVGYVGPIPPRAAQPFVGGAPVVGWTTPSLIYDKMRTIDRTAQELVAKAHTYVDPSTIDGGAYIRAIDAWDAQWTPFYQKYQTDTGKLGAVFDTDGLNRQTEEFRSQLLALYDQYDRQRQPNGQPVPRPATPAPTPAQDPPPPSGGVWSMPWWAWLGIGAGLTVGGWFLYRKYVQVQHQKEIIQREVLPGLIGPGLASAAAARDAGDRASGDRASGLPSLRDYAAARVSGARRESALVYRPYEHPHLVSAGGKPAARVGGFERQYAVDRARDEAYARQMEAERDPFRRSGPSWDGFRDSVDADWDGVEDDYDDEE